MLTNDDFMAERINGIEFDMLCVTRIPIHYCNGDNRCSEFRWINDFKLTA